MRVVSRPQVFLVATTQFEPGGLQAYLQEIGNPDWHPDEKVSDAENLIEAAGRLCYMSWQAYDPEKPRATNPNVTKVREGNDRYLKNILESGHGSVLEHCTATFIKSGARKPRPSGRGGAPLLLTCQRWRFNGNMCDVKLVAPIKLLPTMEQKASLLKTLWAANAACNEISSYAWEHRIFKRFDIHRAVYADIRQSTGLSAQVVVQCIAKAAACYKRDKKHKHGFRPLAAQPFDDRIFRMCADDVVSIWTVDGRIKVPFVCGEHQRQLLAHQKGEVDLQMQGGDFFIAATCDVPEAAPISATDVLGVDLGIVNIAVDSDGQCFSGEDVERCRRRNAHRRRNLQRKGTRASRRKLREISGRQARFQKDVNHCISRQLVQKAKRTERAIALEDLSGIRSRVTARRQQRARLHNWGFFQLDSFVAYKSLQAGVSVLFVDPRYTSQTCPACGHVSRSNRCSRNDFCCVVCGHAGPADHIAARNIRARAIVNWPNGGQLLLQGSRQPPQGAG